MADHGPRTTGTSRATLISDAIRPLHREHPEETG
jgi:hypothetical protein